MYSSRLAIWIWVSTSLSDPTATERWRSWSLLNLRRAPYNHCTIPTLVRAFSRTPDSRLLTPDSVFLTRVPKLVDLVLCQPAAPVPLFLPGIAPHVITVLLPESRQVLIEQLEASHPFRALPKIEMWHEQPCRPAVLGSQRLARPCERDEIVGPVQIGQRQVGGEALLRDHQAKLGRRFQAGALEQRLHRHAFEAVIEPASGRDAMDVAFDRLARERKQIGPRQREGALDQTGNREGPGRYVHGGYVAIMQHRPFGGLDLAGRDAGLGFAHGVPRLKPGLGHHCPQGQCLPSTPFRV